MTPADLDHLAVPGDPQLHPDGSRIAFALGEVDVGDDRYVRTIHLWDGRRTRRFTHGPSDTAPRWSPDGCWLAFLRTGPEEDASPQVHVMPADGGEAQRRTDLPRGVTDLTWSPDSSQLVVVGREWAPELAELDDEERRRRPRRITRLPYRSDNSGWTHEHRDHLWLVAPLGDTDPRCITPGEHDQGSPAWRPDGRAVAFLADPADWPETEPHQSVFEVALSSGEITELVGPGMWSAVDYGPDGSLYLTGLADPYDWPGVAGIWRHDPADGTLRADGHGEARDAPGRGPRSLTGHLDRDVAPGSPPSSTVGPQFVDGGFLTVLEGRGTTGIVRVELDGWDPAGDEPPEITEVVTGRRAVTGFAASRDGTVLAFTATDPASPGELFRREAGVERCLTDLARGLRSKVDLRPTVRFTAAHDGVELDVWAVLPPGFDEAAAASVPVLFMIHGGPTAQFGDHFSDEFQVGAGAGHLVVGANPRGSSGRGTDWARAVVGAWGEDDPVDVRDLEVVVDAALARFAQADPTRVGIMGGSYGGYATARLLARTDRYSSAVVERGLLQWESFCGTSDIGTYFDRMFLATSLPHGVDVHRAASPVGTAAAVTTPTLLLHSEHDWRCPIEQAEQYFAALRRAGVEAEFVRFPDEGHELSRSGSPRHRVERMEIVLEWHRRHLGVPSGR